MANSSSFCWERQRAGLQQPLLVEADEFQHVLGVPAHGGIVLAVEQLAEAAFAHRGRDDHVLHAGHLAVDAGLLEGAQQAEPGDLRHTQLGNLLALEADRALIDQILPDDRGEQRGLARAVRPDQPDDGACRHRQRNGLVGLHAAEGLGDVVDFEQRAHSAASRAGALTIAGPRSMR
jgi:hypothetical protein